VDFWQFFILNYFFLERRFGSIFYPFSNGDSAKLIKIEIKNLQLSQKCKFGKFLFCSISIPMQSICIKGP